MQRIISRDERRESYAASAEPPGGISSRRSAALLLRCSLAVATTAFPQHSVPSAFSKHPSGMMIGAQAPELPPLHPNGVVERSPNAPTPSARASGTGATGSGRHGSG
eukprot:RCo023725